ncbi:hypothetical protein N5T82_04170 [Aliarcobacter cryaerophilus]|uniref:hypothetical protein n=1 Tax=Aliarcobacter cryaerophilus TaxID=28198 RepID=UPI0021B6A35D|nr:hypothetical protein [Aliarcobacter cryaerophilus]MCT7539040.1 hypothetical protein [Aliarcobacter cryaerophilus]
MDISYLKTVFSSISSGVIGGCMVSFFIGQPTLKEFIWIVILIFISFIILWFIGRNQNPTNQDENVE